ncbi:alginate export family protein [Thiomicrorhabdus hydrogeniphila]
MTTKMSLNKTPALTPLALALSSCLLAPSLANAGDNFTEALTGGKTNVDITVRYESVDQDGSSNGSAFTERTRIGYKTGDFKGFNAFVEMSGTESIGSRDDYHVAAGPDADTNAKGVVLDPAVTRLNQAWLSYSISKSNFKVGKQRIIMDNRFLGNVGWRQTEQVYNGFHATIKEFDTVSFDYAYIAEQDTPLGTQVPMATHALQADIKVIPGATITGYGYFIDKLNSTADSQTLGARIKGSTALSESFNLTYFAEYADQSKYEDAPSNTGGDYYHFKLGGKFKGFNATIAQEKLGGDGTSSFQTPLATLHLYNGWADKFLSTPLNGLVDTYATLGTKVSGIKLAAAYHDYKSDKNSDNYGSEVNLLAAKKFGKNYLVGLKYADYSADTYATDTSKLWVWTSIKF